MRKFQLHFLRRLFDLFSLLFGVVKSEKLFHRKMMLGAMIVSLSGSSGCGSTASEKEEVGNSEAQPRILKSCYDTIVINNLLEKKKADSLKWDSVRKSKHRVMCYGAPKMN
jgi:hypothetical protein